MAGASWQASVGALKAVGDDTLTAIMERKQAMRAGVSTDSYTKTIEENLAKLRSGISTLEESLDKAEHEHADLDAQRKWELAILDLSKQHDRLEFMSRSDDEMTPRAQLLQKPTTSKHRESAGKAAKNALAPQELVTEALNGGELVQLQQRIMDGW
ncbi:hypothetical protein HK101_006653 [Irineochytrium annulatum]|nr:hypothetical protein HK101_006653 [Irineochytrium annulatum]